MRKITHQLLLTMTLAISLVLIGCSTSVAPHTQSLASSTQSSKTPDQLLQMASNAAAPEKQRYQILAADKFLQIGSLDKAQQVLKATDVSNTPMDIQIHKRLIVAKLELYQNKPVAALQILQQIPASSINDPDLQLLRHELLANAYLYDGAPIKSVQQRVALESLLTNDEQVHYNQQAIWQTLQQQSNSTLKAALTTNDDEQLNGWIDLAYISKQYSEDSKAMVSALQTWRATYPNHPADSMLPDSFSTVAVTENRPNKIVLLLPLTGKLGASGQAIRNGFMSAYYQSKKQGGSASAIDVQDTNGKDIQQLYQQATQQGANLVVGPLTKQNVEKLEKVSDMPIPVLALNTTPQKSSFFGNNTPDNFYQFSLSPQHEAKEVADKAWLDGHTQAIVITPTGSWGDGIADAFEQQWKTHGGRVVGHLSVSNTINLSTKIKRLLQVDKSTAREKDIENILQEKVKSVPRRRQDVDMIFLAEPPQLARQIRPLIKYYYAANTPIYSTSLIYSGIPQSRLDRDMNGIIFCDMPWILSQSPKIKADRRELASLWPNSFNRYARLYALGIDAYKISGQLNRLSAFPQFGLSGATGTLQLENHRIYRQLDWAQFRNGKPVLLNQRA